MKHYILSIQFHECPAWSAYVSCPRSYVPTDGSYSMVWLSICSIPSSHSCVSIMFHVLARTSRQMGATAWYGSQYIQYYPHIQECPTCFMSSLVVPTSRQKGATAWPGSFLVRLHRAKHAHKHTQSYTMIRLAFNFSKMRWGFGTLASHDCFTLSPCPVKSRPTSGDCHDNLLPGVSISCRTA